MLKISKQSWHYRFYKKQSKQEPTSLCGYFWTLFVAFIGYFLTATALTFIGSGLVLQIYTFITTGNLIKAEIPDLYGHLAEFGRLGLMLIPFALFGILIVKFHDYYSSPNSFLSLVVARIRSFKDKTCPRVEVID